MKRLSFLSYTLLLFCFFAIFPTSGHAVARILDEEEVVSSTPTNLCDRYINENLPHATLSVASSTFREGDVITVDVLLQNNQQFPIADTSLFVEVVPVDAPAVLADQFLAFEHADIPGKIGDKGGELMTQFLWRVPSHIGGGTYRLYPHIITPPAAGNIGGREERGAASFSIETRDKIVVPRVQQVGIKSDSRTAALSDSGEFYLTRKNATVSVVLVNQGKATEDVGVTWKRYKENIWDSGNLLSTKEDRIRLPKGEKKTVSYTMSGGNNRYEFLVGEIVAGGKKSFVRIPVLWEEVSGIRLSYFGVDVVVPKEGNKGAIVACFDAGYGEAKAATFALILLDEEGHVLVRRNLEAASLQTTESIIAPFFLIKDYQLLHARLSVKEKGETMIQAATHLRCYLWENGCGAFSEQVVKQVPKNVIQNAPALAIIVLSIALILAAAFYFINHKKILHDLHESIEK